MKAVHKDQANNTNACTSTEYDDADVEYLYTASQQRLCKIVKPHKAGGAGISDQSDWEYTWYMYDAGGMVMAVYDQSFRPNGSDWTMNFNLEEHDVYGSGRLGIRHGDDDGKYHQDFSATITSGLFDAFSYSGSSSAYAKEHYSRTIGLKQYEVANHLGNVLVTVSDKRLVQDNYHYTLVGLGSDYSYNADLDAYYYTPGAGVYAQTSGADGVLDWYTPDVLSYSDYYAFGAPQTGRNAGDGYRYGFNGMEGDPEMKGQGAHYTTEFRQYDPRVGRWFSPDPVIKPWESPYAGFANNPIYYKDPSGLEPSGHGPTRRKLSYKDKETARKYGGYSRQDIRRIEKETRNKGGMLGLDYLNDADHHVNIVWGSSRDAYGDYNDKVTFGVGRSRSGAPRTKTHKMTVPNPRFPNDRIDILVMETECGLVPVPEDREKLVELQNQRKHLQDVIAKLDEQERIEEWTREGIWDPNLSEEDAKKNFINNSFLVGLSVSSPAATASMLTSGKAGLTVLGTYNEATGGYIGLAQKMNANYFNIPLEIWNAMTPAEQWAKNVAFLDEAIARGDQFVLSTSAFSAVEGTFFWRELQYLYSKGFTPAADGMSLIKQ